MQEDQARGARRDRADGRRGRDARRPSLTTLPACSTSGTRSRREAKKVKAPAVALRGARAHGAGRARPVHRRGVPGARDRLAAHLRHGHRPTSATSRPTWRRRSGFTRASSRRSRSTRSWSRSTRRSTARCGCRRGGYLDHRADRSDDDRRREHRQVRGQDEPRGDRGQHEPRGRSGGGAPAPAPRHRRASSSIDFIDMLLEKNKSQVEDTMKEALALDKTRSQVFEIGPLGLMQVTRKRVSSWPGRIVLRDLPHLRRPGHPRSPTTSTERKDRTDVRGHQDGRQAAQGEGRRRHRGREARRTRARPSPSAAPGRRRRRQDARTASEAAKAIVTAKPLGEKKGDKVKVFKYQHKTGYAQRGRATVS